jgi:hypothetical protein
MTACGACKPIHFAFLLPLLAVIFCQAAYQTVVHAVISLKQFVAFYKLGSMQIATKMAWIGNAIKVAPKSVGKGIKYLS